MTDRPNAEDYRNRCERAEAECKELRERHERVLDWIAQVIEGIADGIRGKLDEANTTTNGS